MPLTKPGQKKNGGNVGKDPWPGSQHSHGLGDQAPGSPTDGLPLHLWSCPHVPEALPTREGWRGQWPLLPTLLNTSRCTGLAPSADPCTQGNEQGPSKAERNMSRQMSWSWMWRQSYSNLHVSHSGSHHLL